MSIKVSKYIPISGSMDTASKNQTIITDIPEEESFEQILVLNQAALKAMTIDHMVANSPTRSVDPDAVDAAAIMKFRSTLKNVDAPIPVEEKIPTPKVYTPANTVTHKPSGSTPMIDSSTLEDLMYQTGSSDGDVLLDKLLESVGGIDGVYNEGELACSDELNAYFKEAADTYNLDVKLLKSLAKQESNFNPYDTSKSGAMGIMQLMPYTAKAYGVENAYNARENIMAGAHLLADLLGQFDGNIPFAVAAYNCGSAKVKEANGIPAIEQTQKHVQYVLQYYNS